MPRALARRVGSPGWALGGALALAVACSEPATPAEETSTGAADTTTGSDVPHVMLLGAVPNTVCDTVGVVSAELQAVRVGCVNPPPAPCTNPATPVPIVGDRISCPITDDEVTLGVRVEMPGEYQVEAVLDRTPDAPDGLCFGSSDGPTSVLVTDDDLQAHAQKTLDPTGQPCPSR